ncbi:uncharacterized protein KGF55_004863 [Candida pseudojiufengensis]|uniref:uncharacterized protein n=1 Tax=Candida pseudojiufengensis TaxID=497109 RepID=UPI0022248100|nr:uncharacterized protein KGF55_004863 [Candida pseudojiufengensis]KAI5960140.1 hypothetical protein KGF55_004863 [Candida pseudojiufengensis]
MSSLPTTPIKSFSNNTQQDQVTPISSRQWKQFQEDKRRSRSLSPVKINRNKHKINGSLEFHDEDDLRTMFNSPNLTPTQLKNIYKNPSYSRLHIVANGNPNHKNNPTQNKYIIPIPLTLKLPPKLSSSPNITDGKPKSSASSTISSRSSSPSRAGSPERSHLPKQTTLIYTPQGYEKIDISSSSEDEQNGTSFDMSTTPLTREILNSNQTMKTSPSPPSVTTNKTKYSKLAYKNKESDELSMIEEMSNYSSRSSSINDGIKSKTNQEVTHKPSKKLPALPTTFEDPISFTQSESSKSKSKRKPPPSMETNNASIETSNVSKLTPNKMNVMQSSSYQIPVSRLVTQPPIITKNVSQQPKTDLRSRCFSDESQTTSVSSFGSPGDFASFQRLHRKTPPIPSYANANNNSPKVKNPVTTLSTLKESESRSSSKNPSRVPSDSSTFSSNSSVNSWNSLQKSIDITLSREPTNKSFNSNKLILNNKVEEGETEVNDQDHWSDTEASDAEDSEKETAPLKISRSSTTVLSDETKKIATSIKPTSSPQLENNNEFDIGYNFPNNLENITNNKQLKSKHIEEEDSKSTKSRYSFYSSNGQIDIPDLSNKRIMDQYSIKSPSSKAPSSYNETLFSDRNTNSSSSEYSSSSSSHNNQNNNKIGIRIPSKNALTHLEEQLKLHSIEGEDSEYEFENKKNSLYVDSKISKTLPDLQCNFIQNPQTRSPARHKRGKSMYNIDLNEFNFNENQSVDQGIKSHNDQLKISHSRSKSIDPSLPLSFNNRYNSSVDTSKHHSINEPQNQNHRIKVPINILNSASSSIHKNNYNENDAVAEDMNIKIAEPPKPINYKIDFKENNNNDLKFGNYNTTPKSISKLNKTKLRDDDNESIIVDLTKDKYEVFTIQRSNSIISYKSTTEVIKGKEMEVILVEEDDDEEQVNEKDDELLSIYSKYRNNSWLFTNATK